MYGSNNEFCHNGTVASEDLRFAIIVSRYNSFITDRLLQGALEALKTNGVEEKNIETIQVPGAFEIPQVARTIAKTAKPDAIICLGALLRGETLHFELISNECARGIQNVAAEFGIPVTFGVITADTAEQAVARAGERSENKGWESAIAAIEMANLYRKLKEINYQDAKAPR
jgi:6,7-dimethyl-8-ribityllumazine synthase